MKLVPEPLAHSTPKRTAEEDEEKEMEIKISDVRSVPEAATPGTSKQGAGLLPLVTVTRRGFAKGEKGGE